MKIDMEKKVGMRPRKRITDAKRAKDDKVEGRIKEVGKGFEQTNKKNHIRFRPSNPNIICTLQILTASIPGSEKIIIVSFLTNNRSFNSGRGPIPLSKCIV